jgi:asparagine N-glycosylation enzyme membrane subunit Stt3
MRSSFWQRLVSFPAMLVSILFVSPFFASLDVQQGGPVMRDPDIWWHLRDAQILLTTHQFIRRDMYSFTTLGQSWINPEWLAEIPYYLAFRIFAERGIFLMMLLAVDLIIAGVLLLCYRRSGHITASWLATWIAVLLAAINIGPRTILFGWLCFLAEMLLLEAFRRGGDRLWLLVPLFALWINLHGTWLIGYAFFIIYLASGLVAGAWGSIESSRWTPQQWRKLMEVGTASAAALFVNPYGWRLVIYPFDLIFHQQLNVAVIDEWHSVDFQSFYGTLIFLIAAGIMLFTLAQRRSWQLYDVLFALLAFYAALTHKRFLFLAGMIVCPMLSIELGSHVFSPYDPRKDKRWLNVAFMAAFFLFGIDHVPSSSSLRAAETRYFPSAALPALNSRCMNQHVLNRYEWGGYLIWNAREIPVFLDSRTDIFDHHGVLLDYLKATQLDNSFAILDRYRIGCVLLNTDSALVYLLQHSPGWKVQYQDAMTALMVRIAADDNNQMQTH